MIRFKTVSEKLCVIKNELDISIRVFEQTTWAFLDSETMKKLLDFNTAYKNNDIFPMIDLIKVSSVRL